MANFRVARAGHESLQRRITAANAFENATILVALDQTPGLQVPVFADTGWDLLPSLGGFSGLFFREPMISNVAP